MAKKPTGKPNGRPTLYRPKYNELAFNYCLLGASDRDLAKFFDVSRDVVTDWRSKNPAFDAAIRDGKIIADGKVAKAMYRRALGYSHADTHVSSFQGEVTLTPVEKHYPPDTAAGQFWLKNRQPALWREKTEQHHTGNLSINQMLDAIDGTDTGLPTPIDGEFVEIPEDQELLENNG